MHRRSYAVESTLYVLAEYLGWIEILRREVQFLDLGDDELTRQINHVLYDIRDLLARNNPQFGDAFRLFRTEQRAIGELMVESVPVGKTTKFQCIGPATFSVRLEEPSFQRWFLPLEQGLTELSEGHPGGLARLSLIQNRILNFMNLLDPHAVFVAGSRHNLPISPEFSKLIPVREAATKAPN